MFFLVRTNIPDYFGTPKNSKHILIYNTLQGCPEKVRKTGGFSYRLILYFALILLYLQKNIPNRLRKRY